MKAILKIGTSEFAMSPENALKVVRLLGNANAVERDRHHPKAYNNPGRYCPQTLEFRGEVHMELCPDENVSDFPMPEVLTAVPTLPTSKPKPKQLNFHGNSAAA